MKKFKVNFTTKTGRRTHRHFRAPNLTEAQAQFESVHKSEARDCEWSECPYVDIQYKNAETGEVLSADLLYVEYLEKHPNRDITFISFVGEIL